MNPRYLRFLHELARRSLKFSERRVLETLLHLTHGSDRREIYVESIAALAAAVGCRRSELSPLVDELESWGYLARDVESGQWWLQSVDLWPQPQPDPRAAAVAELLAGDEQRRRQLGLWPPQPTGADAAVEGVGISDASASEFPTLALPAYAHAQEPGVTRHQIQGNEATRGAAAAAGTLPGEGSPAPRRGSAVASAGDDPRGADPAPARSSGLDARGWMLLREIHAWCGADGEDCTDSQRKNWGWRVWTQPETALWALRMAVEHVEAGKSCKSRYGLVKHFWRRKSGDDKFPAPPRSADRLHGGNSALPAGGGRISAPAAPPPVDDELHLARCRDGIAAVKAAVLAQFVSGRSG